jgi:hypothetical protein
MKLCVLPVVDPALEDALVSVLDEAGLLTAQDPGRRGAWRRAALDEAVEPDDLAPDYAFSPRRTRGATRA